MSKILGTIVKSKKELEYILKKYKIEDKYNRYITMSEKIERIGSIILYYSREDGSPYYGHDSDLAYNCLTDTGYKHKQVLMTNVIGGELV